MSPRFNAARCEGHAECACGRTQHMIPDTSTWSESLRNSAGVERPSEMPVQNMSAVTPTEVLRWRYRLRWWWLYRLRCTGCAGGTGAKHNMFS